mmetsp:Transcript_51912/g.130358  ORF Transcript_51912/g.130358 Transcript_51912/m.130358 type:complete len:246 (-) Transcript_51912:150-887(-)
MFHCAQGSGGLGGHERGHQHLCARTRVRGRVVVQHAAAVEQQLDGGALPRCLSHLQARPAVADDAGVRAIPQECIYDVNIAVQAAHVQRAHLVADAQQVGVCAVSQQEQRCEDVVAECRAVQRRFCAKVLRIHTSPHRYEQVQEKQIPLLVSFLGQFLNRVVHGLVPIKITGVGTSALAQEERCGAEVSARCGAMQRGVARRVLCIQGGLPLEEQQNKIVRAFSRSHVQRRLPGGRVRFLCEPFL